MLGNAQVLQRIANENSVDRSSVVSRSSSAVGGLSQRVSDLHAICGSVSRTSAKCEVVSDDQTEHCGLLPLKQHYLKSLRISIVKI